jgi:FkbM family methyltransferase
MKNTFKAIYYSFLDLITLYKGKTITVNGFSFKMPPRYSRYYPSDYEYENFQFLKQIAKKGMVSIDVGGQFGLMTTYIFSLTNNTVYTFEPTPSTFKVLLQTIHLNKLDNLVVPVMAAVTEKTGKVIFFRGDQTGDASNSLVNYHNDSHRQKGNVTDAVSVDNVVDKNNINKVDILKIDAEGAELSVLKGAAHVLRNHRPSGILALHPASIKKFGDSLGAIYDFMMNCNFRLLYNNKQIERSEFCSKTDLFDVGFVPR